MPADKDPGMAFVLVQHLAPDHKSVLAELIRRCTRMPVFEVEDGMVVRPNCTYVIPPGRDMAFLNGALHLLEPSEPHGHRLPIDFFFRSLASDRHEQAIGIILSGTGSDGTQGVLAIKGEGGMVMAQVNSPAGFDGMPSSAIATGLVDYELPPAGMPARLLAYAAHASGTLPRKALPSSIPGDGAIKKIFVLLRAGTGHDFSQYKPGTIHRRIERRMAIQQIEALDSYVRYLQQTPAEVDALFRDLLIGVTSFFRDPDAFQALRELVISKLFDDRQADLAVRVWVPGCSTGEEAYSIAILLMEQMEMLKRSFSVHVFATDIDCRAIAKARTGLYPVGIASHVSPERLARFFTLEADGSAYRIRKSIRDLLVFSEQDVIKDPPFSKLDLLACRNLLIYLSPALQKKLIPLFHYAMKPGGWLFLGTSEGVGEFGELFSIADRKAKLYERKEDLPCLPQTGRPLPPIVPLVKMASAETGAAAKPAVTARQPVRVPPIRPATADPDESSEPPILPDTPHEQAPAGSGLEQPDAKARIVALERELKDKEEDYQKTQEELESSTEELKSSIEEMQSVNEELQSTNEEMETSKEELQSVNEELATVNTELQTKVAGLARANNDMNNLLAGTGIGTVFVDQQLHVLRFTPSASSITNLIAGDVGRPVAHIVSNLVGYNNLVTDLHAVLDTLVPKELTVDSRDGKSYTMRIQPYRTLENVIEGAVISFVDITEMVRVRNALHKANEMLRLAVVVRDAHDAITVQDLDGRILAWNPGAVRMYGWSESEALEMNVSDRIPPEKREGALAKLSQLSRSEILEPYCTQRITKGGAVLEVSIISTALLNETREMYAIATTERTIAGGAT